ncbi:MAG TPA: hypothetical protein PKA37_00415 [Planctomycetota bacterium]|jgi:hypothetical protein|nr:hypothetical protein [Planctomycetota bacterium]
MNPGRRNPGELQIDLFCHGLRIPETTNLTSVARPVARTRAGLGSGLELVIPGDLKELWLNVPVEEDFAIQSPYRLEGDGEQFAVVDERTTYRYPVRLPEEPRWYSERTSSGALMREIGVLQGTYLGIYVSNSCMYWYGDQPSNCKFCTTGYNVGVNEIATKNVEDVVEVALRAKEESGVTFVHLNTGYQNGLGLRQLAPYVAAIKERVGALVGVQAVPPKEASHLSQYDWLLDLGADHFSFCYEFHHPEWFAKLCPGKEATVGQGAFFRALEYCQSRMPRGSCSGEIIAGVEPIESTIEAIDYITGLGAFPTVCIFRPVVGSDMEHYPTPRYEDMVSVMRHMYRACRTAKIPIGAAPGIEVSLIVNPDDAQYLMERTLAFRMDRLRMSLVRRLLRGHFRRALEKRVITAPRKWPGGAGARAESPTGLQDADPVTAR